MHATSNLPLTLYYISVNYSQEIGHIAPKSWFNSVSFFSPSTRKNLLINYLLYFLFFYWIITAHTKKGNISKLIIKEINLTLCCARKSNDVQIAFFKLHSHRQKWQAKSLLRLTSCFHPALTPIPQATLDTPEGLKASFHITNKSRLGPS